MIARYPGRTYIAIAAAVCAANLLHPRDNNNLAATTIALYRGATWPLEAVITFIQWRCPSSPHPKK